MHGCFENPELKSLIKTLRDLQSSGDIKLALLYGSFATDSQHCRSDIDVALSFSPDTCDREVSIIDRILMSADRQVSILRLDDPDESPFVVQASLKGIHLVEPDPKSYYEIADRVLHESESIRSRRHINHAN